jgi:hypothetical protein
MTSAGVVAFRMIQAVWDVAVTLQDGFFWWDFLIFCGEPGVELNTRSLIFTPPEQIRKLFSDG